MDRMLSLQHCRKVLGTNVAISDEDLARLREQLYCFAELALDMRGSNPKAFVYSVGAIEQVARSQEELELLLERAAIIEYDGNFPKDEAERMAITLSLASEQVS